MINVVLISTVAILSVVGFITSFLRLFNKEKSKSLTLELMILFLGLSFTLWDLSYFSILLATLGGLGVLLEMKKKVT